MIVLRAADLFQTEDSLTRDFMTELFCLLLDTAGHMSTEGAEVKDPKGKRKSCFFSRHFSQALNIM